MTQTLYQVSGSDFTTTSTTLVDVTGLSHAATANKAYLVQVFLRVQQSTANGMQFALAYSAAGATGHHMWTAATTSGTGITVENALGTAEATTLVRFATTDAPVVGAAAVAIGANTGNITVQVKAVTSGTVSIFIGSYMIVTQLN